VTFTLQISHSKLVIPVAGRVCMLIMAPPWETWGAPSFAFPVTYPGGHALNPVHSFIRERIDRDSGS
jgi:hypothetical protein